jgi:hypothetical protein
LYADDSGEDVRKGYIKQMWGSSKVDRTVLFGGN